jgi:selenide,water dikinase
MAPALQAATLDEVMRGAASVFAPAGVDVVGGHTSLGAELTIGFTVTGRADAAITKAGARPGDAIILTKALGTGTIMAAEMAMARVPGLVLGEVVARAMTQMQRPSDRAAAILAPLAHAMTDVTGFGLAGHLLEVLRASGCAAVLEPARVPVLPGALALAGAGHAASLAPANRADVGGAMAAGDSPLTALMFDPQTAGGLLATVPGDAATAVLDRLLAAGEEAAIIGHVMAGAPAITVA